MSSNEDSRQNTEDNGVVIEKKRHEESDLDLADRILERSSTDDGK